MKIAMVTPFPEQSQRVVGGVAGVAKYLAEELAKDPGIDLTVVVPRGSRGDEVSWERIGPVRVCRLPRRGPWKALPGTLYDAALGRRQLAVILEVLDPDVVHFQGTAFLAGGCRRPSVLTIHGIAERDAAYDERRGAARWLKRRLLGFTEGRGRSTSRNVILISDASRDVLTEDGERRVWRIDNAVAETFFAAPRLPEPGRIFCCSRVRELKNVVGLIEAFGAARLGFGAAVLRVGGAAEPAYLERCRRRVLAAGLGDSVRFLGALTVPEVQEELSRASCFVLPSFQENAPLSLAEAMAAGVPAVASRVGGVPEMIEDGASGILVDPNDPHDIGQALLRVLGDDRLARSMGRRGRELALRRHRASAVARRTLAVYREIVGSGA